ERAGDISLLSGYFLDRHRRRLGLGPIRLTEEARQALLDADWPGNVRELDHVLGRGVLRASAGVPRGEPLRLAGAQLGLVRGESRAASGASSRSDAPGAMDASAMDAGAMDARASRPPRASDVPGPTISIAGKPLSELVDEVKRAAVNHAVEEHSGNWAAAARSLGMARGNLHHLGQRLGLLPDAQPDAGSKRPGRSAAQRRVQRPGRVARK
ncbi:MAG TPA: hypothetical protein VLC09_01020, partial [Polyangiaceae bacterium]|nr:hypothetical protein [Polyangiaceae bacterium]